MFLKLALAAAVLLPAVPAAASSPLVVNIDNPNFRKLVAAIPEFKTAPDADADLKRLAREGPEELGRLLAFSGLFNVMQSTAFSGMQESAATSVAGLEGIDLAQWKGLGAESLTVGELAREGTELTVSLRTADINQGKLILGKKYSKVTPDQFKKVMAKYADRLLEAYTGKPGIFSSKLVFVGRPQKGAHKQIYVSDFDGSNVQQITREPAPHLSPSWSRDGRYITYTSFEDGDPDIFMYELATGKKRKLSGRKGIDSGANWAANNKIVAFTASADGDTDIHIIQPDGKGSKPLLRGAGLDVDPAFSPNGRWLAFVSGRFGNPHIFVAELKWDNETTVRVTSDKRLTYAGWYNATPAWSPESDKIAFTGYDKDIDRWDIFMMNPDGTQLERLTIRAGDNERPSWAPNGQMLVFHSSRAHGSTGRDVKTVAQLYVMNRDGSSQRQLVTGIYEAQTPAWGPPLD